MTPSHLDYVNLQSPVRGAVLYAAFIEREVIFGPFPWKYIQQEKTCDLGFVYLTLG